jgi:hypothetical protein
MNQPSVCHEHEQRGPDQHFVHVSPEFSCRLISSFMGAVRQEA